MKYVLFALAFTFAAPAFASYVDTDGYLVLKGAEVLGDQYINQMDDVARPPQGYRVKLDEGYRLVAVDVVSNGSAICGLADYNSLTRSFKIEGYSLETDEQGCDVYLTIYDRAHRREMKFKYSIEQVGT